MRWRVLYGDWSERTSEDSNWKDIPNDNVQIVDLIFPSGNKIRMSGVDKYAIEELYEGRAIRIYGWKDENPEENDPYYGMGRSRIIWDNEDSTNDTGYIPVAQLTAHLPQELIKRGKYVDERTARAMFLL